MPFFAILCIAVASIVCYAQEEVKNQGQRENILGSQLTSLGLYDEALKHYLEALSYFRKHKSVEDEIRTKNGIFLVYYHTKRLREGEDILLEALEQMNNVDTLLKVSILNNLGIVYASTLRTQKALDAYMETMKLGANHPNAVVSAYINIADLYFQQSDYKMAERYLTRGLSISSGQIRSDYRVQMLLNMALIKVAENQDMKAREYLAKASKQMKSLSRSVAMNAYAQMADVYLNLADSTMALGNILKHESLRDSIQANIDNVHINSTRGCTAEIYSIDGRKITSVNVNGETAIELNSGVFIVVVDGKTTKVEI